ncbi:MAG: site-2 protease family protein, partial [Cyanobacteria bacterium REEB65]|nr:site-2 protease family protein [Cyanobacteria bacterium REEB65]
MPKEALSGWQIARLFGIPIEIAPSWILIFVLIFWSLGGAVFPLMAPSVGTAAWAMSAVATFLFFACLVAHELSHSL